MLIIMSSLYFLTWIRKITMDLMKLIYISFKETRIEC